MKEIHLSKGQIAIVDDQDFEELSNFKWSACYDPKTKTYYAVRSIYTPKRGSRKMHREILKVTDPTIKVDHQNGNTLDNRRTNIRVATTSQNGGNRKLNSNNTSGLMGVGYHLGKYRARIQVNGKRICLGSFDTAEEAAKVRDNAALEYFGEFAKLNFRREE